MEIPWAREFLRALYPNLNGKKYVLTVETYFNYDRPDTAINWLRMDVGEGAKDLVLRYGGGCVDTLSPAPLPGAMPPEFASPTPPLASSLPSLNQQSENNCSGGAVYPKQFLSVSFQFDREGRLTNFGADGPFINDRKAGNEVYEIVRAHPQMMYAEIVAALKLHGTKYGPDDKEQFVKDLPLKELEQFLGKLQILSVGFHQIDKDPDPTPWIGIWPDWTVKAEATTKDGAKVPYEMHFSHLNGYLTGLVDCRTSPWCNHE